MSIRVLVSDHPHRTLALATESHVLLFKHAHTGPNLGVSRSLTASSTVPKDRKNEAPRCMVEFLQKSAVELKGYRTLTTAKGTLGLITLGDDVFVCVATGSREVATVRPGETVQQIVAVEFYCLNRSDYDHAGGYGAGYRDGYREPNPYSNTLFEDEHSYESSETIAEHPFMALKKILSSGSFYYSYNFDLTRRLQDRADADTAVDIASLDEGLLWNSYMINPLLSFRSRLTDEERGALDHSSLLTSVIRGYVGTLTVPQSANPIRSVKSNYPATLTLISRLSSRRAGTRFNARGVDDDGNVANFVETETIFWSPTGICFSYVQVRGSIPIFWESSSTLIPGQQKIQITRSPEATQLSFDRHFDNLIHRYGIVHVVNLLSETKPGEVELTERYNLHMTRNAKMKLEIEDKPEGARSDLIRKTEFDFHEISRVAGGYDGAKQIKPLISESAESFLYFLTQEIEDEVNDAANKGQIHKKIYRPVMVMQQTGIFRTNCLDCLDRTNLVQGIISQTALELFLEHRGEIAHSSNLSVFWMRHSSLWADNGDALSKIYAGTGALKSSFTRHGKMSLGGLMADARKSATRLYVNHFEDKGRQNTTDLLLGRLVGQEEVELFDPVSDWVQERLRSRANDFESSEVIRVWVGTYNLNGKMLRDASELRKWLDVRKGEGFEIVVVGFQEIVELSPQQIMNTDPARRTVWEQAVKATINETSSEKADEQYILLRSGQLVGAALMVFVKSSVLSKIKNVEGAIKKTGVSGLAGNKGAVAIRMEIQGSSVCFVTAHLAAGFGNYDERNRDYQTIITGLRFQRDRKIEDHEVVIWLGDFNYRIGTRPEYARDLIDTYRQANGQGPKAVNALHDLYKDDQLNIQMVAGQTFPFYQEGAIKFLPTYKFDLGNDNYDTSEKARIPAWTDRILYKIDPTKGTDMRQTEYTSVMNLRFSDHRPVYSTFNVQVRVVDEQKKGEILKELYAKRYRQLREDIEDDESDSDADDLVGYQSIAPGLPPASSDRRKWWLDGDKPVASKVVPPEEGMKLNPDRNGNPWREGGEDDWVLVEELETKERNKKEAKSKPEPPAPRKAKIPPSVSIVSNDTNEERNKTPPPKPPAPRGSSSRAATLTQSWNMAGAWPQSRNLISKNPLKSRIAIQKQRSPSSSTHKTISTVLTANQLKRRQHKQRQHRKPTRESNLTKSRTRPRNRFANSIATKSTDIHKRKQQSSSTAHETNTSLLDQITLLHNKWCLSIFYKR
ncbi:Inositol-1,4,5-trisphosphate 5-phosphatase 1 [Lithohypha guttulata]|uniref:phosphoinositide 5-phosphatase n=1 Tax=Lithohypha guttulata TaxID=1690604 RepID=A0AAN7YE89_9EURO|nr:Inositol-1,4,5-trisphosphate 5-phosphatase 1 [Lithohypha guttulata]